MCAPAGENIRPEIPTLIKGVNNVAKIIDEHQIEIAIASHHCLKQTVIPVHRPSEHRLAKGVSKILRQILVLRNLQHRIFLELESRIGRILQDVNVLQNRASRAEITELIKVSDWFTEITQIEHRPPFVRFTETLADLAKECGIHFEPRRVKVLN